MPVVALEAGRAPNADHRAATSSSFLRACVLLLLHERPAHGYDLMDRLGRFGFDAGDSGWLYRTLRSFEDERLCVSAWESSPVGPRRRTYHLTGRGEEALASSVDALRTSVRTMENYLDRYVVASSIGPATAQECRTTATPGTRSRSDRAKEEAHGNGNRRPGRPHPVDQRGVELRR